MQSVNYTRIKYLIKKDAFKKHNIILNIKVKVKHCLAITHHEIKYILCIVYGMVNVLTSHNAAAPIRKM